jgi:hypothetical protein
MRSKLLPGLAALAVVGVVLGVMAGPASARTRSTHHYRHHRSHYAYVSGVRMPSSAVSVLNSGQCDWLAPYLSSAGLPVRTFEAISARESGCSRSGVHVVRRTDLSTSRFGLNFRGSMPRYWASVCGTSDWTAPGRSVVTDVTCAAAAYHRQGLRPWR